MSRCWLLCKVCGTRELVQAETVFGPCPECGGGPRFARSDDDKPMLVWSGNADATSWDVDFDECESLESQFLARE